MAITLKRSEQNFPFSGTRSEKVVCYGQETKKYRDLLHSIATNLGLSEKESSELVEYVCRIGERNFAYQKENYTLRIWLSKLLVHNCIFKITSRLFSQNANAANFFQANNYLNSSVFKMPISFRTVYILFHPIGFTEPEIAQILNITPMQARDRLSKAMTIIESQHF